jgi:TonB-linked SusC/RagA family outer membrane protein
VAFLLPVAAAGQQGTLTGTVRSEVGQPLADVVVTLVGANIGVLTNARGAFQLTAPAGTYSLLATSIGYASTETTIDVLAGEARTVELVLAERAIDLEELVVTLSAVEARREQVGTDIERVNVAQEIQTAAVTSLSDVLNSRSPGVNIALGSGEVGSASKIRVRGATSLTQSNNPLIFIDGVRVNNDTGAGPRAIDFGDGPTISRLDDLNPADIADLQVLKGPTAAAAYGSEAAAGVLIITTKRGTTGAPQFQFSTELGVNQNVATFEDNYFNLTTLGGFTDLDDPVIQQFRPELNPATGDIFGRHNPLEIYDPFRLGGIRRTSLSVQGGAERLQYFASMGWDEEEGVLPNNDSERVSGRGNFTTALTDAVDLSLSSTFISNKVRTGGSGRSPTSIITNAQLGQPQFGFGQLPDGSQGDCAATVLYGAPRSVCEQRHGHFSAHPDKIAAVVNTHDANRFIGGLTLSVRPADWLASRLTLGIDHLAARDLNILPLDPDRPFGAQSRGEVSDSRIIERVLTFDQANTVSMDLSSSLGSTTTVGAQYFNRRSDTLGCTGREGFAGPTATACNASVIFGLSTQAQESAEAGAYLQETLAWNDYLFVTGALRANDYSGVGQNQGAIYLPSANASLVVSRMPFWNAEAVNNLRLRVAWGQAAQAPGPYDAIRTFVPVRLDQGGVQVTGISPQAPGNPDLKHERNEEYEFGFDASFMDDRVSVKLTYYDQSVTDAIMTRSVSPGTGFPGQQSVNIGKVENNGIEGFVDVRILDRPSLGWSASLGFSTEDPIITDMGGLEPITGGLFGMAGMFHEGYAPGAYFGPIYVNAERAPDGTIVPGSAVWEPGNLDFGQDQGFQYLGRPNPTNQQTLNTSMTLYNSLTFSALFNRRAGHKRMDTLAGRRNCFIRNRSGGRMCAFREAELTPAEQAALEGRVADAPMLFLNDASFIKLRELTVRYALPSSLVARIPGASFAALSAGGRNLVTWTDYPGVDPEVDVSSGVDSFGNTGNYGELDPARIFFARLTITF